CCGLVCGNNNLNTGQAHLANKTQGELANTSLPTTARASLVQAAQEQTFAFTAKIGDVLKSFSTTNAHGIADP
ncbi:MAG: hypothetical protein ACRENP_23465, partial [Longimicrobiales bacterium]